jgi:hypothetical protein
VPERRQREIRNDPVLSALATLSEHRSLTPEQRQAMNDGGCALITRYRIGFVVIDMSRTSDELRDDAIAAFRLKLVDRDGVFELYEPALDSAPSGAALSTAQTAGVAFKRR